MSKLELLRTGQLEATSKSIVLSWFPRLVLLANTLLDWSPLEEPPDK